MYNELIEMVKHQGDEVPVIKYYKPENKLSDVAVVVFPGGGYTHRAVHEGEGYAEFLAENGISAFVVEYTVRPENYEYTIYDSRRAVRYVRYHSEKYGIDKNKIIVAGSSAGGHLAASLCTYFEKLKYEGKDEIDKENFVPDGQIICYGVTKLFGKYRGEIGHTGTGKNLLSTRHKELYKKLSPICNVSEKTPKAFIWHTMEDDCVPPMLSFEYAKKLYENNIEVESHFFAKGPHGMGILKANDNVKQWAGLMLNWIKNNY